MCVREKDTGEERVGEAGADAFVRMTEVVAFPATMFGDPNVAV